MDAVKAFNAELSSLYDVKPPISKAKMTALTRGAIKAIKFYKHVVQSVEKFILKCKSEYKVPGLYVIDSIVRQSRHQFGSDKDVFAPRFSKNMQQTFINLFRCPAEDKSKIIRVLNLWQKNQVFPPEVIQPLFDLTDPNNPIYKEMEAPVQQSANGLNTSTTAAAAIAKGSPALQRTPTKGNPPGNESVHGSTSNLNFTDPNVIQQLQQLQRLLTKGTDSSLRSDSQVYFDRKLLDFDYGDDEDDGNPSPRPPPPANDSVSSLLTNPEVLRQLQTLQQTMAGAQADIDADKLRKLQEMKQQEDEFDKHLAQTVPNLPFASECEFKPTSNLTSSSGYFNPMDVNSQPVIYNTQEYEVQNQQQKGGQDNGQDVEVITLDHDDSRSHSPSDDRYSRRRRSRSRSRDRNRRGGERDRDRDRRRRSRSRSANRRHRSRSRDRNNKKEKKKEEETERDKERKKRGLPIIKKDHLSICSTTLWVGHLSKLVHQDDLSNTFGEFGDVVSIDLIPPRGCAFIVMLRRQDAARCLLKLKGHILHQKAITLAWAPGKGVKGKDLKDYWEGDLGVSYVPYSKIKEDIDIEMLEDGGMIDEETMPQWMKEKAERLGKTLPLKPGEIPGFIMGPEIATSAPSSIDTSQPPPMPTAATIMQPTLMPLVSPFHQFNNRLLGMPGMMPPNISMGVPPPNMAGPPMMPLGMGGSPFQGPPGMLPPHLDNKPAPPSAESNLQSLGESLMSLTQQFMVPQPPAPLEDLMDVEMEDAEKEAKMLPLSEQLQQQMQQGQFGRGGKDDDRRDRRDDRDRNSSRSRDRDRDRERDRDRNRDRRDSRDRDRDRRDRDGSRNRDRDRNRPDNDRRSDRNNRWGGNDRDRRDRTPETRDEKRDREKNLNDRLREMAGMGNFDRGPERSANQRDRRNSDTSDGYGRGLPPPRPRGSDERTDDFPPHLSEHIEPPVPSRMDTKGPLRVPPPAPPRLDPPILDRPLDIMLDGPPDLFDRPQKKIFDRPQEAMFDRPPQEAMFDRPQEKLFDRPPQEAMFDRPPQEAMFDRPPQEAMFDRPKEAMFDRPQEAVFNRPQEAMFDRPSDGMFDGPPDRFINGPPDGMFDGPPLFDGPPDRFDGPPKGMFDGHGPSDGMFDSRGPPNGMFDGPPDGMFDGPPDGMFDGPPDGMFDGPPDGMFNGPSDGMFNGPPDGMFNGPPMRMQPPPFRGRRGGDFNPRGMRGPPDFFPHDDFGPRGPPRMMRGGPGPDFRPRGMPMMGPRGPRGPPRMMRGGPGPDFGPRGMGMRGGPRGQFFGPRGPRGGPRGPNQFRDGPNFNPRMDGPPEFFRGPRSPPPQFEGMGSPPRLSQSPTIPEKPERRSRWSSDSPTNHRNPDFPGSVQEQPQSTDPLPDLGLKNEEMAPNEQFQDQEGCFANEPEQVNQMMEGNGGIEGGGTPVFDEFPAPVEANQGKPPVEEVPRETESASAD